ncbi:MAG: peptidylprolyl isomerase [Planctomycetes bacterium]|nr:peptidylprolyl isomerase [Planctomycetota bacterium]
MILSASLCLSLLLCPPQEPGDVVATYQLLGEPAQVTRTDVALDLAFHLRRRERGRQGVEMLLQSELTRRAANKAHLMPTEAEVRVFWAELQRQLRAAGREPDEFAAVRNTSERQWLEDLSLQMAQERLVRRELDLRPDEKVGGDMLKLWMQEQTRKAKVQSDPDQLPPGTALRLEDHDVPMVELGMLLLRTSEDDERNVAVHRVAYLNTLDALCRREQVALQPADLDRAIEQRRKQAEQDARFRGASFESVLQAEGLTTAALRESRVFRGHVLLELLAQKRFPDATLAEELVRDRAAVLERVGPRRRLSVVFLNAMEVPNELVKRDFAAAMERMAVLKQTLANETFANVAALASEHAPTRKKGGDLGWHRRSGNQLPTVVAEAAFTLPAGGVSEPLRGEDGVYLIKVVEIEPEPTDAVLLQRLRELRARELGNQLIQDAKVQLVDGKENGKENGK